MSFTEKLKSTVSQLSLHRGLNVALTGGPSVGKTTQVERFAEAGFPVLQEMALTILDQALAFVDARGLKVPEAPGQADPDLVRLFREHGVFHPLVDNPAFQRQLLARQLKQEQPYVDRSHRELVVMDRTYIEILPYCKLYGIEPPEGIFDVRPVPSQRVDVCFYLQSHGGFDANGRRVEKAEEGADIAKRLGPSLARCYSENGVLLVPVPAFQELKKDDAILAKQQFIWTRVSELAEEKLRECEAAAA